MKKTNTTIRSLIRIGSTHLVSLPPAFIEKNKLRKGDKLALAFDDIVIICTAVKPEEK
ncbi:hypothetical protein ES707_07372 [subsurface metagenome]